jgi:energy-coupling factor transporter ATP-binding protein EcfA2
MRLKSIALKWFRGAGPDAEIAPNGQSIVIFGLNGAGKSSFVDAIEAILRKGKVGHLSHEYAGRNQEKALVNTERPAGTASEISVVLTDGSSATVEWQRAAPTFILKGSTDPTSWDYRRTVLRQEELAGFIQATKGEKYSALLPLLGLSELETVAENLHRLALAIDKETELSVRKSRASAAIELRKETFGTRSTEELGERLRELKSLYAADVEAGNFATVVAAVLEGIRGRLEALSTTNKEAAAIKEIASSSLLAHIGDARSGAAKIAELAEPLIQERLNVVLSADGYLSASSDLAGTVTCPACGKELHADDFRQHIEYERTRLSEVAALYAAYGVQVETICDEVARLRNLVGKDELGAWSTKPDLDAERGVSHLKSLALGDLRKSCNASHLDRMEENIGPLLRKAIADAVQSPPHVETLVDDQNQARALNVWQIAVANNSKIKRIESLVNLTKTLESEIRFEIRSRAKSIFFSISQDIQTYWRILQPLDVISEIHLEVPTENEKAIEVLLKFHGKHQESPRLTLSEGQRNALGLCIFLAMANKAKTDDSPIILDDVVISFDREHRSQVARLLQEHFSLRQIIILTHDREWYFELQRILPSARWDFKRLIPYSSPSIGIQFANQSKEFGAAATRAKTEPEEALAIVRRLMDVALSELAERIKLPVAHVRGDLNDYRTAGEFLVALERTAGRAFQRKNGSGYAASSDAVDAVRRVKPEMAIWANRGTHTFSASTAEAEELIGASQQLLKVFTCDGCSSPLSGDNSTKIECRCGNLRWRLP